MNGGAKDDAQYEKRVDGLDDHWRKNEHLKCFVYRKYPSPLEDEEKR